MHSYGIRWQNGAENGELFLRVPSSILMSVTLIMRREGELTPIKAVHV